MQNGSDVRSSSKYVLLALRDKFPAIVSHDVALKLLCLKLLKLFVVGWSMRDVTYCCVREGMA